MTGQTRKKDRGYFISRVSNKEVVASCSIVMVDSGKIKRVQKTILFPNNLNNLKFVKTKRTIWYITHSHSTFSHTFKKISAGILFLTFLNTRASDFIIMKEFLKSDATVLRKIGKKIPAVRIWYTQYSSLFVLYIFHIKLF